MKQLLLGLAAATTLTAVSTASAQTVIVPSEPVVQVSPTVVIPEDRVLVYRDQLITAQPEPVVIEEEIVVGESLPDRVVVRPVPEAIVAEVPEAANYHYVVANERIVFVEPGTQRVVAVIRQ